jgi:NADH-quinone oxidoreductase subunit N
MAKYYVFLAAIRAGYMWLVIIGLLTSVIALYYYAGIIRKMYFPLEQPEGGLNMSASLRLALTIAAVGTVLFGVYPGPFVDWVKNAAELLMAAR